MAIYRARQQSITLQVAFPSAVKLRASFSSYKPQMENTSSFADRFSGYVVLKNILRRCGSQFNTSTTLKQDSKWIKTFLEFILHPH
jgi:hypothetical protein